MMYCAGLIMSMLTGYLTVRLMSGNRIDPFRRWLFGAVLGFGLSGQIVFYTALCLGLHQPWVPVAVNLLILAILFFCNRRVACNDIPDMAGQWPGLGLLAVIALLLVCEALYYPLGGWDAWSCWNLKAKFIYLGADNWKALFDPVLWRSNTHYPLLLPCITVFFWDAAGGPHQWVPMINGVLLTVLCAGILLFCLQKFTVRKILAVVLTAAVFLLPFNMTLAAAQYSDILLGLLLLCAFVCVLENELVPAGIFLGLLSFTKTEGMAAAAIVTALVLLRERRFHPWFLAALFLASLPTIIFLSSMAPKNEAFINGLVSAAKPSAWQRLQTVLVFPFFELTGWKWNGVRVILLAGLLLKWKAALSPKLRMFGIFLAVYLVITLAYYQVNTFFEIGWWMQTTLHRVLFSLLPSLMLWLGLAL